MKKLSAIFVFLLFAFLSFGQIPLSINNIDEFNGSVNKVTRSSYSVFKSENSIGNISLSMGRVDSTYFLILRVSTDLGCLSQYDGKCMIKFSDGTILNFAQGSETDCSESPAAQYYLVAREEMNLENVFQIMKINREKIESSSIDKIRVYGSKYYADYIPNPKFREDFNAKDVLIFHIKSLK